jgi:hypothetical protein
MDLAFKNFNLDKEIEFLNVLKNLAVPNKI